MEATNTYPNLKPCKPGQSGNPAGKPPGTRRAFSQGFIRDIALEAVRRVARKSPETFVAIAAKVYPADVGVALEQQLPGNLSPEEWATMREIVEAVRQAIPDASSKSPGAVLSHVLEALRMADAKPIDCP